MPSSAIAWLGADNNRIPLEGLDLSDEELMAQEGSTWFGTPLDVLAQLWSCTGDALTKKNISDQLATGAQEPTFPAPEPHDTRSLDESSDFQSIENNELLGEFEVFAMRRNENALTLDPWIDDGTATIFTGCFVLRDKRKASAMKRWCWDDILSLGIASSGANLRTIKIVAASSDGAKVTNTILVGLENDAHAAKLMSTFAKVALKLSNIFRPDAEAEGFPLPSMSPTLPVKVYSGGPTGNWTEESLTASVVSIRVFKAALYLALFDGSTDYGPTHMVLIDTDFRIQARSNEAKCVGHALGFESTDEMAIFGFAFRTEKVSDAEIMDFWRIIWRAKCEASGLNDVYVDRVPPCVMAAPLCELKHSISDKSSTISTSAASSLSKTTPQNNSRNVPLSGYSDPLSGLKETNGPSFARFKLAVLKSQRLIPETASDEESPPPQFDMDEPTTKAERLIGYSRLRRKPQKSQKRSMIVYDDVAPPACLDGLQGYHNEFLETTHEGRSFVFQRNHTSQSSKMSVYNEGSVFHTAEVAKDGKSLDPRSAVFMAGESKMAFSDGTDPTNLYLYDLERSTVISELKSDRPCHALSESTQGASLTDASMVLGLNDASIFQFDTRSQGGTGPSYDYATNPRLQCLTSTGTGGIATGAVNGQIRLFNGKTNASGDIMRAKTALPVGHEVTAIDSTTDGEWLLVTGSEVLSLLPLYMEERSANGFDKPMGSIKPQPIHLNIPMSVYARFKPTGTFRPGKFSRDGEAIFTSIGNLVLAWDFESIRRTKKANIPYIKVTGERVIDVRMCSVDGARRLVYIFDKAIEEVNMEIGTA